VLSYDTEVDLAVCSPVVSLASIGARERTEPDALRVSRLKSHQVRYRTCAFACAQVCGVMQEGTVSCVFRLLSLLCIFQ
jgi:hypothetical protein